jgi:hypothetical protein
VRSMKYQASSMKYQVRSIKCQVPSIKYKIKYNIQYINNIPSKVVKNKYQTINSAHVDLATCFIIKRPCAVYNGCGSIKVVFLLINIVY